MYVHMPVDCALTSSCMDCSQANDYCFYLVPYTPDLAIYSMGSNYSCAEKNSVSSANRREQAHIVTLYDHSAPLALKLIAIKVPMLF